MAAAAIFVSAVWARFASSTACRLAYGSSAVELKHSRAAGLHMLARMLCAGQAELATCGRPASKARDAARERRGARRGGGRGAGQGEGKGRDAARDA